MEDKPFLAFMCITKDNIHQNQAKDATQNNRQIEDVFNEQLCKHIYPRLSAATDITKNKLQLINGTQDKHSSHQ